MSLWKVDLPFENEKNPTSFVFKGHDSIHRLRIDEMGRLHNSLIISLISYFSIYSLQVAM